MNLRDLEYALAVAEHGHFSRAAEACAVTQPTLSGQLRKLEDELGVEIFERDGRTIRVTRVGREILGYARAAIEAVSDLERTAQAGRDPLAGTLRLGVIPTLGPYLLPHLLAIARERISKLPLAIVEEPTALLIAGVNAGNLDAAIVATSHANEGLSEIPIFDEPLWLVVPKTHAFAARGRVALADIDARTLLLPPTDIAYANRRSHSAARPSERPPNATCAPPTWKRCSTSWKPVTASRSCPRSRDTARASQRATSLR